MVQRQIVRVKDQICAAWKFCLATRKRDWVLRDYPVAIREQKNDPEYVGTRYRQYRYSAAIINWWVVTGLGDTKEEALQDLAKSLDTQKLERAKEGKPLPRPGTRVPIEFASQARVNRHAELAEDFVRRILDLEWVWISDQSSLWDFHARESNDELIAKIKEVYGVDVSDIDSAKLCEILERLAEQKSKNTLI